MAGSISDKITKTRNGARPNSARVLTARTVGGPSLACDNLAGWPTSAQSKVHFVTYKIDTNNAPIAGSQCDWTGLVAGSSIGSMTLQDGTDAGNAIGDVVEMLPTAAWGDDLYSGFTAQHSQLDGSHGAVTATSVSAPTIAGTTSVSDAGQTLQTYRSEMFFDYVSSGLAWGGDAYGSTRAASMGAGVVYIGGKRLVVAAVTARTFAASSDTYVDIDNTGTPVYTAVANNATSPVLAANSLRIAIVVTGATNILNSNSINQGQEYVALPIASSIPYTVTDSLGNLICPRDPNRRILGYKQITTSFTTTSGTVVQVTGLTCPVIVPTGRKVKLTAFTGALIQSLSPSNGYMGIWDTSVAGTQIVSGQELNNTAANGNQTEAVALNTPSANSKTFVMGAVSSGGSTLSVVASATNPAFIMVELV